MSDMFDYQETPDQAAAMNPLDPDCPHDALLLAVDELDNAIAASVTADHLSHDVSTWPADMVALLHACTVYHNARIAWEAV